uniref:shikimate kinase AroL n=1 Tax=uncultured Bilophila sp. TaxID=529385 RepID=UPI0025D9528C|nr:shikimate kinase AroL [uncultured Bilophila sp.]
MTHTIYLVGARAAGKTTFGGALARRLGCRYVDTDVYLLETTGETVADIVAREGWEGFRKRESDVLRAVTAPGTVIATGGGMVLAEANRRFMRDNGIVLYLSAPAEVLAARLQANPNAAQRPTLTGKSIVEEVNDILEAREALYRAAATHVLNAAASPRELLAEALAILEK